MRQVLLILYWCIKLSRMHTRLGKDLFKGQEMAHQKFSSGLWECKV